MDNLTLAQLVYTRISHDLSGAAGAVYNGTELLAEDPSFIAEATDLIQTSATNLMARMRFFRQTFGLPKPSEDTTKEYLKTFSMPFDLKDECSDNLQRALVMTLTDYFYRGATFEVSEKKIVATGKALKDCTPLVDLLSTGMGEESALNAPAFFAWAEAKKRQITLKTTADTECCQISIDFY